MGSDPVGTPELTPNPAISPRQSRGERSATATVAGDTIAVCAGLLALTAAGAGAGVIWPGLAGFTAPHPTLHPTLEAIVAISTNNGRVLALAFILTLARFDTNRRSRQLGDAVLTIVLGVNAVNVGVALGRWQARLLPYLPHLPVEYLAAAAAAGVWCNARRHASRGQRTPTRAVVAYAAGTLLLVTVAASSEVLLTPHAP